MDVKCQCGAVELKTPSAKPIVLYHCHCLECRKQSASAFGTSAIFKAAGVLPLSPEQAEKLSVYTRPTSDDGCVMDCYFCKTCGVRMFHQRRDAEGKPVGTVSVKGGCVEGLDWSNGIHIFTRSAVVPIPEGAKWYEAGPPRRG